MPQHRSKLFADQTADPPPRTRRLRRALRLAGMIRAGTLTVVLPDGTSHCLAASETPAATIVLKHPRALRQFLRGDTLGIAEAYGEGLWDSPDIRGVMALVAANEDQWKAMLGRQTLTRGLARLWRLLRPGGPRRGLVEQYDLGREFFASWLDPSMSFSSAWFEHPDDTLEAAQLHKIHRLCRMLRLAPGMRLLEIGCGWGGFAEVAARDYGVSVVGVTLCPAEYDYGKRRIAKAGLSHRVELRRQDYRDVMGTFDRIAAIEIFERLAEDQWPEFCAVLRERLRKNGVAGLQIATIADRLFEADRGGMNFLRRRIFSDATLPSKRRLRQTIVRAGMAWGDEHWFARHYADTLARWQDQFQAGWPRIESVTSRNRRPCGERVKRLWEYYLATCETGFRAGWIDVGQILIAHNG
jgi:cyclopropane-fatty-acyl-phospholipid synthase